MTESREHLFKSVIGKFSHAMASPSTVKEGLNGLRELIGKSSQNTCTKEIEPLFNLLQKKSGEIAAHIFSFLADLANSCDNPVLIIKAMINTRNKNQVLPALESAVSAANKGTLTIDYDFIEFLADCFANKKSYFDSKETALKIVELIEKLKSKKHPLASDTILSFYLYDENIKVRLLTAWLLDKTIETVTQNTAKAIIGVKMFDFFEYYLSYTRATHTNLLQLQFDPDILISLQNDFEHAREVLGNKLLLEVIARLGWSSLNLGLKTESLLEVSIDGSPPIIIFEAEGPFVLQCDKSKKESKLIKVVGCGNEFSNISSDQDENEKITIFRNYNINHAALLNFYLDISPLSVQRVRDIISRMDKIVTDYVDLFSSFSDECAILPEVYTKIKNQVLDELDKHNSEQPFSSDLMQTVLFFEEPRSLGEVRTLHGLKRYLHQQGLAMGFKLAEGGRSPNRTINLLLVNEDGIQFAHNKIRFSDFDSSAEYQPYSRNIPYSVGLLIEGFFHQIVHGEAKLPKVDIFCYGNEVHYYFGFRNHPAFLRIDYAPPLRGGMIDLEYFGVSNYDLNQHPNISLDYIRTFFEYMDFDFQLEATRIHARYDKERALTLGDLCEKANQIFNLAPYFMDLDWLIGSLALDQEARKKVSIAWADFFTLWGFIPLNTILSKDRLGIVKEIIDEPTRKREVIWNGEGDYKDIYDNFPYYSLYQNILRLLNENNIRLGIPEYNEADFYTSQINIETRVLKPIRQAITRGELIPSNTGLQQQSPDLFLRINEAELFAKLLNPKSESLISAIDIANIIQQLEKNLSFNSVGSINGHLVQNAILVLRGEPIRFYVLRGGDNIIRLAFFIHGLILFKTRKTLNEDWQYNANYDSARLTELLWSNNFIDSIHPSLNSDYNKEYSFFLKGIRQSTRPPDNPSLPNERIIRGQIASPGLTVGRVVFGTKGRDPLDLKGSLLVASSLKPEDTSYLYYADGIISTGGGILSHAGLIAMQLRKPAIIISGNWHKEGEGEQAFFYRTYKFQTQTVKINRFNVSIREQIQEKEYSLNEGDLVIIDALTGIIKVLGQNRSVLGLFEGFRSYRSVNILLALTDKPKEILKLRGERLRALHQIANILLQCDDPVLSRYVIFEILLNNDNEGMTLVDISIILSILLNNSKLESDSRDYLVFIMNELESRLIESYHIAEKHIPTSGNFFETISMRLDIKHSGQVLESARKALEASDFKLPKLKNINIEDIEDLVLTRLSVLQNNLVRKINNSYKHKDNNPQVRHLIRQLERINILLPENKISASSTKLVQNEISVHDDNTILKHAKDIIIDHKNCGFELFNQIGWKAANLAEIDLLAVDNSVPPWFVVTDYAFQIALSIPVLESSKNKSSHSSLREAINSILDKDDLNNEQKSWQISELWDGIALPKILSKPIISAYRSIIGGCDDSENGSGLETYVAIRSSSTAEDTEAAAHAGEFETFLYIKGDEQLLLYLKRTWSGLWTERAIHNRSLTEENSNNAGGGVIVQRMVNSRVSGVLQTVNIPRGNIREMVINAGLGLGEGVVSGIVGADQITVSKDLDMENDVLHFNYITGDKTEQVLFNKRSKSGTVLLQTLYHQRLRPALEYIELCQLVKIASSLEKSYGYPLDIEFGIEDKKLWLLQVRPVTAFHAVLNETKDRFPLACVTEFAEKT